MADANSGPPPFEARLAAAVLRDFPLCVVVTDAAGTVLFLNRAGERLLGYSADEVTGASIAQLRASGRHQSAMLEVEETLKSGFWAGEIRARHKDGEVFPALVAWSVVRAEDDPERVAALVVVFRDLTPERRREERLVREARERTTGRMAGRIAHEFNNLFAGMISAADFALSEGATPRLRRALAQCLAGAERGSRVTHLLRMLAFEAHPAATGIELEHLLDHLLRALAGRAADQQVEVVRHLTPAPPVVAEVGLLEQAIDAMLLNALEAMPGGGRLTVGLATRDADALVTISDTGPGIPPELEERIFEPFFTTKESQLGEDVGLTGLGLALTRRIIEDLGGRIELSSPPGQGATFALVLPGANRSDGEPQPGTGRSDGQE